MVVSAVLLAVIVGNSTEFRRDGARWVAQGPGYRLTASATELSITNLEGFGDVDHWFREEETQIRLIGASDTAGQADGERVSFRDVYPGVEFLCRCTAELIECTFSATPGAATSSIRMALSGARRIRIEDGRVLRAETRLGELRVYPPPGGGFVRTRRGVVAFQVE